MAAKEKKQPEKRDDSVKSELMQRFRTHPFLFIGTVIILAIVIVAFVFVPAIVPNAQMGGDLVFGYYNKVPIKYMQENYFAQVMQSLSQSQQPSQDDPNYVFTAASMWRRAFEETVVYMGILDEMKQAGFKAPESVVDREVAELPTFQENGRFSAAKYRAMDNNRRMTLWRQVQEGIAIELYMADTGSLRTASGETAFVGSMASPRRSFDLAIFPFSSYPESEIAAYAAANPGLFRVTRLSRITVNSSENEAQQVLDSVKNGVSTFEEAAKTNSQDFYADQGGDMGVKMAHELAYEIVDEQDRERIINLPKGSISDLVKVPSGWAFFRAEDAAHPADTGDFSQMQNVRNYIMANLRGQVEDWVIGEAEKFSAQAKEKGFDEAISEAGLVKQSLGPLPVNYGNLGLFPTALSSGLQELGNAGTNDLFWKTAFKTPLRTPAAPLVIGDSVITLFPLEESSADEDEIEWIESYYPFWMADGASGSYRPYFLTNEKLDDRFEETFWKLWS